MRHAPSRPRRSTRRGDTIVETLVATVLLTVGVLALFGLTATLARDERRVAARRRAAALLAERASAWEAAPCGEGEGTRTVGGLVERWRATVTADSLALLADSVVMPVDPSSADVGVATLRRCAP